MSSRSKKVIRVAALTTLASFAGAAFASAPAHRSNQILLEEANNFGLAAHSLDWMGFNRFAHTYNVMQASAPDSAAFSWLSPLGAGGTSLLGNWGDAANWSPSGVPGSTAAFDDVTFPIQDPFGNAATLNIANANLSSMAFNGVFNNRIFSTAVTNTISTPGGGTTNLSTNLNFKMSPTGETFSGTLRGVIDAAYTGGGGIRYTGNGMDSFTTNGGEQIWFARQGTYTGQTTIENGALAFISGGRDIGAAGRPSSAGGNLFGPGQINVNGAKVFLLSAAGQPQVIFNQTFNVGSLGAAVEFAGADSPLFAGDITGSGTLRLGLFGDSFMNRSYSFTGVLLVDAFNFNTMNADAALPNVQRIDVVGARFDILDNISPAPVNRVPDNVDMNFWGSGFEYIGAAGFDSLEDVGNINLQSGVNTFTLIPEIATGNRVTLVGNALNRVDRSAVMFARAPGLGNTGDFLSGQSVIRFDTAPTTIGGGGAAGTTTQSIIPFVFGVGGPNVGAGESFGLDASLVTYDAVNGIRPLNFTTEYQTNIGAAGATENVRLTANANSGAARTINALALSNSDGTTAGTPLTLNGGALTITSGVILNTAPGNVINNNLVYGSAEAIFLAAPFQDPNDVTGQAGGLTVNGVISGSNGLTVAGGGDVVLTGNNTFTGPVTVSSSQLFITSSVSNGVAGPLGQSSDPIRLVAGGDMPTDGSAARSGSFEARLFNGTNGTISIDRPIQVSGRFSQRNSGIGAAIGGFQAGAVTIVNGTVNVAADTDITFGGGQVIVNGVISGGGRIATNGQGTVTLNGANTHTGGAELGRFPTNLGAAGTGTVRLGHNQAFGTGLVFVARATNLQAIGDRTIANNFRGFAGLNITEGNIHFSGNFDLNLSNLGYNIASLSTATFSGSLSRGGFFKLGAGTALLTGDNSDMGGLLSVGNPAAGGPQPGGVLVVSRGSGFGPGGLVNNNTQVITGSTLRLDPALSGGAPMNFADTITINGQGVDVVEAPIGAIQNSSGNNTTSGDMILTRFPTETANSTLINVAGGTSFTVGGTVFDLSGVVTPASPPTPATRAPGTAVLTKIGGGVFSVGATFNNQIVVDPNTGTSTISQRVAFNNVTVNAGTFRITPGVTNNESDKHLFIKDLNIAAGAKVDLTNNSAIVDYTGSSPRAALEAQIQSGYAGGTWAGNGITSSSADGSNFALGIGDLADTGFSGNYLGTNIDNDVVLIRYTRYGDANLDGITNISDFARLGANFNLPGRWATGDFNYDNVVNIGDFSLLAANFNLSAISAARPGAVPEPATLGALALGAAGLTIRRRRA